MLTPTSLFKCLADETRLRCLVLLHQKGRLCVCELTAALNLLQPKISRHLALLRQSKILLDSREGQWVYYQINPGLPQWVADILEITVQQFANHPSQQEDLQRFNAMANDADKLNCCE